MVKHTEFVGNSRQIECDWPFCKGFLMKWVNLFDLLNPDLLTLSWRRPLSYRNQSIDLLCSANQWTGFYMITVFVMKQLKDIATSITKVHCFFLVRRIYANNGSLVTRKILSLFLLLSKWKNMTQNFINCTVKEIILQNFNHQNLLTKLLCGCLLILVAYLAFPPVVP